jgi:facilitated trehalose transporter
VNSYLDYYTVPFIVLSIFVVFFVGFPFACESPKHLVMKRNLADAEKALKYFRGYGAKSTHQFSKDFQEELEGLKSISAQHSSESVEHKLTWADFTGKAARKGILIGVFLNFLTIMNGVVAITNYSETVFVEAGSTLSPALSSIIVAAILLMGSYTSSILSDRVGRRLLMGISATGCGVSLSVMGANSYLKEAGYTTPSLAWIPLVCLSVFMLLGSIGIMSLHFVIMSEVLSQKIRGIISTFCLVENWMLAFISVKVS